MCGIAGVFSVKERAPEAAILCLFAQQHRGQESCGIVYSGGDTLRIQKNMGLVREAFREGEEKKLHGRVCIGHVRYPTQGNVDVKNAQPHLIDLNGHTPFAIATNGDIVNYYTTRHLLESAGISFYSENDGELLGKFIGYQMVNRGLSLLEAVRRMMEEVKGAYSGVLATPAQLWVFRDPLGVRPLVYGYMKETGCHIFASESVALDILGADYRKTVQPGEIIIVDETGIHSERGVKFLPPHHAHCVFELIYFSRPDSLIFDTPKPEKGLFGKPPSDGSHPCYIHGFRKRLGKKLAEKDRVKADVVIGIPDSGTFIAMGYSEQSGIPFSIGLVRSHYVGRTFIRPEQRYRDQDVREKFNPVPGFFEGKKIIVVDDSIVRGTTMKQIIAMIREAGAKEVHLRIGSPPMRYSCFYGIDTPNREHLIANIAGMQKNARLEKIQQEVGKFLGVDSLLYLSLEELREIARPLDQFCYACFSGQYPMGVKDKPPTKLQVASRK